MYFKSLLDHHDSRKTVNTQELITRLKKLHQELSQLEQESTESTESITKELLHLIQNKEKVVRVLVACCIADIMRINAPNCPFDNQHDLHSVLALFASCVEYSLHASSPLNHYSTELLKNLTLIKTMTLINEIAPRDANEILQTLLMFTKIDANKALFEQLIAQVIESIDEFELDTFIQMANSQISMQLSKDVIQIKIHEMVLNNAIEDLPKLYKNLWKKPEIVPENLLIEQMFSPNENLRISAMELASKILLNCGKDLKDKFMMKKNDKSVNVRQVFIQLLFKQYPKSLSKNEFFSVLSNRLMDPDEHIRHLIIQLLIETGVEPNQELIEALRERHKDKRQSIRQLSMKYLLNHCNNFNYLNNLYTKCPSIQGEIRLLVNEYLGKAKVVNVLDTLDELELFITRFKLPKLSLNELPLSLTNSIITAKPQTFSAQELSEMIFMVPDAQKLVYMRGLYKLKSKINLIYANNFSDPVKQLKYRKYFNSISTCEKPVSDDLLMQLVDCHPQISNQELVQMLNQTKDKLLRKEIVKYFIKTNSEDEFINSLIESSDKEMRLVVGRQLLRNMKKYSTKHFQMLIELLQDEFYEIRQCLIQKLIRKLNNCQLPPAAMILFAFCAFEPDTQLKSSVAQYLHKFIQLIHKNNALVKPESTLAYLIHSIAHYPDYSTELSHEFLNFYLSILLTDDNSSYSLQLCQTCLMYNDVLGRSDEMWEITRDACQIIQKICHHRKYPLTTFPKQLSLGDRDVFQRITNKEKLKENLFN